MKFDLAVLEEDFVLRRAFRSPDTSIVRADLLDAFEMSPTKASNLLSRMVEKHPLLLRRSGKKVHASTHKPPTVAGEDDLAEQLQKGLTEFAFTGLRPDEFQLHRVALKNTLPLQPDVLWRIMRSCMSQRSVQVKVIGVERGDAGKWHRFVPLCLEQAAGEWDLVAHDLDAAGYPMTLTPLSRITDVQIERTRLPRDFVRGNSTSSMKALSVQFDNRLTNGQVEMLRHEFRVMPGERIELPLRRLEQFKDRIARTQAGPSEIWPPFKIVER